ncbi:hypothetical protein DN545_31530, partial [Burkholderia multivorans]
MTRITLRGSSRVLGASIIGASLLFAGALPAATAGPAESPAESIQKPAADEATDVDDIEIVLGTDAQVTASTSLVIPVTVRASDAATT